MSFIGDLFSGSKGAGYQAQAAPFAQGDLDQQNAFLNALFAANPQGGLNELQTMLMSQAKGEGPNPAQAMLSEATGKNAAQTAALMGSQRGVAQNPGLLARSAATAGAGIQQQAAGQAATLGAEQQLAAQRALQGQLLTQQGNQGQLLSNLNNNRISMQSNINNANAGIAAQNAKSQAGLFGGLLNGVGAGIGGLAGGAGGAKAGAGLFSEGGEVESDGPSSFTGKYLKEMKGGGAVPGKAAVRGDSYRNDKVPALLSPKEIVLPRSVTMAKDAPERAAKFVEAIVMGGKMRKRA